MQKGGPGWGRPFSFVYVDLGNCPMMTARIARNQIAQKMWMTIGWVITSTQVESHTGVGVFGML
ncbi:MAG: hypothetical protein ACK5SM_01950 [Sphingomonadales bacterium]|jgi:hypothetical protein